MKVAVLVLALLVVCAPLSSAYVTVSQLTLVNKNLGTTFATSLQPHIVTTLTKFQINQLSSVRMFLAQVSYVSKEFRSFADAATASPCTAESCVYRGRGALRLVGKQAYTTCSNTLKAFYNVDLVNNPDSAGTFPTAIYVAGCVWANINGNTLASSNNFVEITRQLSGGTTTGLTDRQNYLNAYTTYVSSLVIPKTGFMAVSPAAPAAFPAAPLLPVPGALPPANSLVGVLRSTPLLSAQAGYGALVASPPAPGVLAPAAAAPAATTAAPAPAVPAATTAAPAVTAAPAAPTAAPAAVATTAKPASAPAGTTAASVPAATSAAPAATTAAPAATTAKPAVGPKFVAVQATTAPTLPPAAAPTLPPAAAPTLPPAAAPTAAPIAALTLPPAAPTLPPAAAPTLPPAAAPTLPPAAPTTAPAVGKPKFSVIRKSMPSSQVLKRLANLKTQIMNMKKFD